MTICRCITVVAILCLGLVVTGTDVSALSPETELLLKLLEKKGVVSTEEARELALEIKTLKTENEKEYRHIEGIDERLSKIEDGIIANDQSGEWVDGLTLSGAIEVEANYESMDFDDASVQDTDASDLALATVELGVDADIVKHVKGHVLFKWEGDPVDVDEGFIILDGEDSVPFYLNVGKLYVPFGQFESHFISDPMTLEIGETNQNALKVGYANDWIELSAAIFNGDIDETGDDDHMNSLAGSVVLSLPEGVVPDLALTAGVSYLSNIADSDGLEGETPGTVSDSVGGFSAFLSASFRDKVFVEIEYLGATDDFAAGELSFDGGSTFAPRAWNIEVALAPVEGIELAARYEGSDDLGDFAPESQYGVALSYDLFESTSLAFEYLHATFQNNDERDLLTTQLAVEF